MPQAEEFIATGRRKTSVARVRMMQGSGKIDINGRTFEDYFPTVPLQNVVLQPLQNAKAVHTYDLFIRANASSSRRKFARPTQIRGLAASRSANERAKKIRATRRAEAVPVLQTLKQVPPGPANGRDGSPSRPSSRVLGAPRGHALPYGFFGNGAGGACGAGAAGANIGGTFGIAAGGGVDVVIGFSKRSCCIASPAQKLVRNWVRMVSQIRRASSFRFFAFRMYTCESMASGAAKLLG